MRTCRPRQGRSIEVSVIAYIWFSKGNKIGKFLKYIKQTIYSFQSTKTIQNFFILFFFIDTSVKLENLKLKRDFVQDPCGVFSKSSLVKILMQSFTTFESRLFAETVTLST